MDREAIGPYRLIRLLGKGGMGAVFEALHETIERRAAIKILHPEFASNQEYTERFINEARAANRIGHPSIVAIYDTGTLTDGTTYLVMEFLDGETLTQRLRRQAGRLSLFDALWIGVEVASATSEAHKKGIIHRDLKPDNIMLVRNPDSPRGERAKLLDFGIAKFSIGSTGDKAATQIGTVMGTPSYMPPEQLRDTAHVTDRADVYALGALIYQMLSGQPPFIAASHIDLMAMHLRDEALPLAKAAPEIPPSLGQLVDAMLAKEPLLRPPMEEVTRRLQELLRHSGHLPAGEQLGAGTPRPSDVVPETIVRSSAEAAVPIGAASASASSSNLLAMPSASTLSGSASQAAVLETPRRTSGRRGYLFLAGVVPIVIFLVVTRLHRPAAPIPAVPQLEVKSHLPEVGTSGRTAPPAVVDAAAKPSPPQLPRPVIAPGPSGESSADRRQPPVTPAPPPLLPKVAGSRCLRTQVVVSCVEPSPRSLPVPILNAVVRASRLAGLKICAGQKLRAVREGKKMVFEPAHIVPMDRAAEFSDTLRGLLPSGSELPSEVIFRCGK